MNNPFEGMIDVKEGVSFHPRMLHHPEIWPIFFVIRSTCPVAYIPTITSGIDGKHRPKNGKISKHYLGYALDFRIRDFPESLTRWVNQLVRKLGDRYTVLLEIDHIHIQYDGG